MNTKSTDKYRLAVVLLVLLLIVTACLPADEDGEQTTVPVEKTPVTLQLQWVTQAQFAGYYVALDKGWYQDEGIELTIKPGAPDIHSTDEVVNGVSDFGTVLLSDLVSAIAEEDMPLISIAQIQQENGLLLLAKKSSGIETPADFVNKRVGVWLGSWEAQFNALMAKEGLSNQDFRLVAQGYDMTPFITGKLDVASAMIYNEYHTVIEGELTPEELNIIDYADYGLGFPGDVLFTSRELVKQQPELAVKMLRATLRGWEYAIDNPEEAVNIVLKYDLTGTQEYEHQLAMMREMTKLVRINAVRPLGYIERQDLVNMLNALEEYGTITKSLAPEQVYTNEIWEAARLDATE